MQPKWLTTDERNSHGGGPYAVTLSNGPCYDRRLRSNGSVPAINIYARAVRPGRRRGRWRDSGDRVVPWVREWGLRSCYRLTPHMSKNARRPCATKKHLYPVSDGRDPHEWAPPGFNFLWCLEGRYLKRVATKK
ncbi:hypothetical protein GW17_00000843 [Ensete ventricosum]|nr:hypothetical protein GW17_00000843 [Ensete ventricosum]